MAKKSSVFLRGLLKTMPAEWRNAVLRERLEIPSTIPSGVTFSIASAQSELEQAFRILHDAYVGVGLMKPAINKMRISVYHALPTSIVLVAKKGEEVLGTVTLIRDSRLGLPSDKILDLTPFRNPGQQTAEISALAIKSEWRGQLFFPLLKYVYQMATQFFAIDIFVISVHRDWYFFYEALLFFKPIDNRTIDTYEFANFVPVVGEYLDLREGYFEFAANYAHLTDKRNLFKYFCKRDFKEFIWPSRRFTSILKPAFSIETINYFFNVRTDIFKNLSEEEYWIIFNIYRDIGISEILPRRSSNVKNLFPRPRRFPRIPACLKALGKTRDQIEIQFVITEVSVLGFKACLSQPFEAHSEIVSAKIQLGEFETAEVMVNVCWSDHSSFGCQILVANEPWQRFIEFCEYAIGNQINLAA